MHLVIDEVSTGVSYHSAEHTFEFPHRLWCQLNLASCQNEQYVEGISKCSYHGGLICSFARISWLSQPS
jgi:hypothetical protein